MRGEAVSGSAPFGLRRSQDDAGAHGMREQRTVRVEHVALDEPERAAGVLDEGTRRDAARADPPEGSSPSSPRSYSLLSRNVPPRQRVRHSKRPRAPSSTGRARLPAAPARPAASRLSAPPPVIRSLR